MTAPATWAGYAERRRDDRRRRSVIVVVRTAAAVRRREQLRLANAAAMRRVHFAALRSSRLVATA